MPFLKLSTNIEISAPHSQQLLETLSKLMVQQTGKPERYVMIHLAAAQVMSFAGSANPLAFLECKSIGLSKQQAKALAEALTSVLNAELSIASDRIYIEFTDCEAEFWAWNGNTFA